jgi:Protein of unknown function (DUF1566)
MGAPRSLRALWLCVWLSSACSERTVPPTQVVVSIDSDLEPGSVLSKVSVDFLSDDGGVRSMPEMPLRTAGSRDDADGYALPLSFAVVPGQAENFVIRVRGYGREAPDATEARLLVEQRARARFRSRNTALVRVFLARICVDRCDDDSELVCYPTPVGEIPAGECGPLGPLTDALTTESVPADILGGLVAEPLFPRNGDASVAPVGPNEADDGGIEELDASPRPPDSSLPDADGAPVDAGDAGPTDICAANEPSCGPGFPCEPVGDVGYTCRGQWADWPMPSNVGRAEFRPSYDKQTPGVVRDVTGLTWQRELPARYDGCTQTTSATGVPGEACTQDEAVRYCAQLALAGYDDWRLPSLIELQSIVDESVVLPAIDSDAFPSTPPTLFWTSSSYLAGGAATGWVVNFETGNAGAHYTTNGDRVRCVRASPLRSSADSYTPSNRYRYEPVSNSVTDRGTTLTWQRTLDTTPRTWADAQSFCNGLGSDYRLPTMKELATLVDPTRQSPAIDPVFEGTPADWFWTESPWLYQANRAWAVSFATGDSRGDFAVSDALPVRCVR